MIDLLSKSLGIPSNINIYSLSFVISIILIIISFFYLKRTSILNKLKKRKFSKLFNLDMTLEKKIDNFRKQKTTLFFHFIQHFDNNKIYKEIYFPSQKQLFNTSENIKTINYIDNKYPYKYNIADKIILIDNDGNKKPFLIVINKYVENHYNIIIDIAKEKTTFSLEIILYSKIKKYLEEINKLENLKKYKKENHIPNMLRLNIINAREEDLLSIYTINMEKEEKSKIDRNIFSEVKENLLLNIIFSKEGKIAFRRIFENPEENIILYLNQKEINLLKELYNNLIKKYINADLYNNINIQNFKNEFILFDKAHGYSSEIDPKDNKEINIQSDLRNINIKFKFTPFYIWYYSKDEISIEELKLTEYLCYLNLLLLNDNYFLDKIQNLNEEKNLIFNKYSTLSNKDKSLIIINLLTNEKKNTSNYKFKSFYDLSENSPYIQSELFFRKAVSQLNDNSSLSFLYLQLNSGSGKDYLTKAEHYKIRMIPLLGIKFHLLKEFFHPYFFTYDTNNNIFALNNIHTQIISFNESRDIGYTQPKKLSEIFDVNNMIKLAFLKFHEHAHIKLKGEYDDKLAPRYLLNDNFELIDNKDKNNNEDNLPEEIANSGESGNALEYFIFNDYSTLNKLFKSKENLSSLNNINLLIKDNFDELRRYTQQLTKNVIIISPYDYTKELSKKYKEKIKQSDKLKNKKLSKIRLSDLDIDELYKGNY